MATNIPPHNLSEICDAVTQLIENPETTTEELAEIVKGPDFPTAGIIFRMRRDSALDDEGKRHDFMRDAIKEAYADGRGRIIMQAKARDRRDGARQPRDDHRLGAAVPGEQGDADREDRRPREGSQDRRHQRPARRVGPPRHAHRHRADARGPGGQRAEPALQAHRHADVVRGEHGVARRRPAEDDGPQAHARGLHRAPARCHPPPHGVRAGEGARARAPAARLPDRAEGHRQDHRPHPRRGIRRRRQREDDGEAVGDERDPGAGRARPAAPPPRQARTRQDRGRVQGADEAHRVPRRSAQEPAQDRRPDPRRHGGGEGEVRRRAQDADRRVGRRRRSPKKTSSRTRRSSSRSRTAAT